MPEQLLIQTAEEGISKLHEKGYFYLKERLLPAIEQIPQLTDQHLLSEIYCLVGDLQDLNGAPLQAIKFYKKAITLDNNWAAPYQELANSLAQIGQYFEAFQYINLAIEKDPDDADLIAEKQEHQDNMNYDVVPFYTANNEIWKLSELLAEEQFEAVITHVLNTEIVNIELLKCLNRAYGALGKVDLYLDNWRKMNALEDDLELDYGDWFYMPREVYKKHIGR